MVRLVSNSPSGSDDNFLERVVDKQNNFSLYVGVAIEDKVLNSRILKVYCKELLPFMEGGLDDLSSEETFTIEDDILDAEVDGTVTTTNHVTAEWFSLDTNRVFPPDVVKGEQVFLFRYQDNDIYYWISMGRDDKLRRGEILRHAVSDDMRVDKELDDTNTYFIELDTKINKRIRIVTNKSDGEDFKYEFIIDAKHNYISMADDADNRIIIESEIPRIKMHNRDGSILDLNKGNAIIIAPNDLLIRAERQIVVESKNITTKAEQVIKNNCANFGVSTNHTSFETKTMGISGSVDIMQTLKTDNMNANTYNTGGPSGYPPTDTNPASGTGTVNSPSSDSSIDSSSNRHCVAWEDMVNMMQIIQDSIAESDNAHGVGTAWNTLVSLCNDAIMHRNKGE